ncbi:hypothetical protein NDU88_006822 [Pleurodeles waltl]|uniref:Ig-like domain-containing protein n=1 Tax=Pleurodeles waltl TaxID=8319 RepID=A0AAV7LT27_PLEWA|nr:hypothetical protein NDU88_006822 [Pleurodeles waltl]
MAWVPLLLVLTGACRRSAALFLLVQPPSASSTPGQTATLTCTRSSGSIVGDDVSWYQQKPGAAAKLIIYKFSSRPLDVPPRFSASTDSASNAALLTITGILAEDDARYYCLSHYYNTAQ